MYIGYTEEQQALRAELRDYYAKLLTPELRQQLQIEHGIGKTTRAVVRRMGEDGWLGVGWPVEYGGQGRSHIEQFIFFDESMRCGAPVPMLTINTVGPSIMKFGSDEQKTFFLPKILKGEIHFCIGYTEPNAGTDLAALRTRADRDGDQFVINGQKVFTSLASDADYIWLACRTDQEAPKHKGISMIVAEMSTPGIKVDPMHLLSQHDINTVFLEDVRVPASNVVGEVNDGWTLIINQLNHERVTLCAPGMLESAYDEVVDWTRNTVSADGVRLIDREWVQVNLAKVRTGLEFLRLMNWKVAWTGTQGTLDVADASAVKVFGTEFYLEAFRLLMEIVGPRSYLSFDSPDMVASGKLETLYRSLIILTFGGGTNEIQRDLIAMFGLGLPRSLRG